MTLNEYAIRYDPIDVVELGDMVAIGLLLENAPYSPGARKAVVESRARRATEPWSWSA